MKEEVELFSRSRGKSQWTFPCGPCGTRKCHRPPE
jgi:hypothetical protein